MSTVDFVVVVITLLSVALAIVRGFVREVLTIVAWAGAGFVVLYGLPVLRPIGRKLFTDPTTADIATGAFLGISTLVLLSIVAHFLGKAIKKSGLTPVDRALGALFGAARAALLLCLAYILVDALCQNNLPDWMKEAKSQPILARGADRLKVALPQNIRDMLNSTKKGNEDTELPPKKPGEDKDGTEKDKTGPDDKTPKLPDQNDIEKLIEKNLPSGDQNGK